MSVAERTSLDTSQVDDVMLGCVTPIGGALQFINQYGVKDFVARAQYLAGQYGERFAPPALLLEKAAKGQAF